MLQAINVNFQYPGQERKALDDVSIELHAGCFTAVLGHNGSGKSTLARLFNALLTPADGDILVDKMSAVDPQNVWDIRARVGMVFQNPDNQIVATTVEEDVAFGPENLGIPSLEIRRRVEETLKIVDMLNYRKSAPHHLSGGQKQRVAIAGVLAMQPKYIFFDEATAMLDPRGRAEVIKTIKELHTQGIVTPVLITHFMEEAAMAERVIIMSKGKIVLDGEPQKIFTQVERLQELKLSVPGAAQLSSLLRKEGIKLPEEIITNDELVEELCHLK